MATRAEALAVMFDHAEEAGEYGPELVARVIRALQSHELKLMRWFWDEDYRGEPGWELQSLGGERLGRVECVDHERDIHSWFVFSSAPVQAPLQRDYRDMSQARDGFQEYLEAHGWTLVSCLQPDEGSPPHERPRIIWPG